MKTQKLNYQVVVYSTNDMDFKV